MSSDVPAGIVVQTCRWFHSAGTEYGEQSIIFVIRIGD